MKFNFIIIIGLLLLTSCGSDDSISQGDLDNQFREILAIAESEPCVNVDDWLLIGVGAKPCGGPSGYIAYSVNIDTETFLALVEDYNKNVQEYNEREGLISDCAIALAPSSIRCENDKAVLVYESNN